MSTYYILKLLGVIKYLYFQINKIKYISIMFLLSSTTGLVGILAFSGFEVAL